MLPTLNKQQNSLLDVVYESFDCSSLYLVKSDLENFIVELEKEIDSSGESWGVFLNANFNNINANLQLL